MNAKYFITAIVLLVLCCLLYLFKPFLLTIAIAVLMAVATANLHHKIFIKTKRKYVAPIVLTTMMSLLFFAPLAYTSFSLASSIKDLDIVQIQTTITKLKSAEFNLPSNLDYIEPKVKEALNEIDLNNVGKNILNYASNFTKSGVKFFTELILIIIFYFFANYYGVELVGFFRKLMPLKKSEFENVLGEVSNVMSVVFYSVIITAVFEGLLFAVFLMYFGYNGLLMGILYAISSLIPLIGGALLWVPVSLYEYSHGNTANAIIIALYSIIMISIIADTFVKPLIIRWINEKLLKTPANVNELLIFFAMIAGISTFGFWGVILGPAILALFLSVVKLYVLIIEKH
ncbi:AI-2E family transporter [Campylobacter sp. RM12642]|uniref:AI-2E family transporter n=1 Tax=unclassified Campylobacter TaxID=2593542 RepID=UPI001DE7A220|nr:AI-2E family transporter [Campylobacter sp. RM12642]MBZ8007286.1 AI-2E family transporter [Campylobacter sp. RM9334]